MTRCLIVDGSSVVRKVAKRILTTPQDIVHEADSGQAALGALATHAPDIIFIDGDLSDMSVTDFIRYVRNSSDAKPPKIVLMLTEMDLVTMTKAKRAGADDYLLKPFDRDQLTRRLQVLNRAA